MRKAWTDQSRGSPRRQYEWSLNRLCHKLGKGLYCGIHCSRRTWLNVRKWERQTSRQGDNTSSGLIRNYPSYKHRVLPHVLRACWMKTNTWINALSCSVKGKNLVQRVTWLCDVICVVGMATRLWARRYGDRIPARERDFSIHQKNQTDSGAHPAAYSMTAAYFAGGKPVRALY